MSWHRGRLRKILHAPLLAASLAMAMPAAAAGTPAVAPPGARVLRDLAYGPDPRQRYDLYLPARAAHAPLLFYVHGGGWRRGDKTATGAIDTMQHRWTSRGAIVASANYRLLPDADPLTQARDVAHALAAAQAEVARLGGDPRRTVLIGHSAGAHLVGLLDASPALAREAGTRPWAGSILLDSAALDVVAIMSRPHPRLYDQAFGTDPDDWRAVSPRHLLHKKGAPILAVCSTLRRVSCDHNAAFLQAAEDFGTRTRLLREPLSHGRINHELGKDSAYTRAVEDFLRSLGLALDESR